MPRFDGQLKGAQLEEISATTTTPAARSRVFSDITDTTLAIPKFHTGTSWVPFKLRNNKHVTVTTTATLSAVTEVLSCDGTGGAFSVALPASAGVLGQTFHIRKTDTSFNGVTLDPNAAELIDGAATITLSTYGEWVEIMAISGGWITLKSGYFQGKVAWTPTGSWTANTPTYTGFWWRTGNMFNGDVLIALTGAPTNASLTVNYPTGVVVDLTKQTASTAGVSPYGGLVNCFDAAPDSFLAFPFYQSNAAFVVRKDDGDGTVSDLSATAPFVWGTGDSVQIKILGVPVTGWRG